ncbi:MAG: metallophosphoesterase [Nanoarchaeota archaeon]
MAVQLLNLNKMMNNFIIFGDMHFYINPAKSVVDNDYVSSWVKIQFGILDFIFDYARQHDIKTIIHNGDLFEEKNRINQQLYNLVWEKFYLSKDFEIIFNIGNHDMFMRGGTSLKPFQSAGRVITEPTLFEDAVSSIKIIPYGMSVDQLSIFDNRVKILITHELITDLTVGPNQHKVGAEIKRQQLRDWEHVFNNHIHKPQELGNIVNVGSPMRQDWGEAGETKRFIHCRDGFYRSINVPCPKFYDIPWGEIDRIDDTNFYRVSCDVSKTKDPIFKKYNVCYKILPMKERKIRMSVSRKSTEEDELEKYIDIVNPENLDRGRLLKIGMELIGKGE